MPILPLQVFTQVGGEEWSSLAAFHDCVGDINADQRNDMMEHEMESQRGGGDVGEVRASSLVAASGCTRTPGCTYRRYAVSGLHITLHIWHSKGRTAIFKCTACVGLRVSAR